MREVRLVAGVFVVALVYAVVRYHVFGAVEWHHLPVFVTNKAVSVAGLAMLGISRVVVDKSRRKHLGLAGAALTGLHVLLSLMLFEPAYLAKIYRPDGAMTGSGELSMLAGAVATIGLAWLLYATVTQPIDRQAPRRSLVAGLARVVLLLAAAHVAFVGWQAWLEPSAWQGRLPPITLLSFAIAVGFCVVPRSRPAIRAP